MPELRKTLCNRDCPDTCSITAHVEDGRVTKIGGDPDHPVTRGFLCWRTNQFLKLQYSPDRVTQPLLRDASGELRPVSWEVALDHAAATLSRIRAESGPAAIFHYRSGGTLGALAHLTDYFFEKFGPVTIKRGDICSGAGDAAQLLDFGVEDSHDLFDLYNARNVILWGKNVVCSSPHLVPILKEAQRRGARLTSIDPVHHRSVGLCDLQLQPRPGGDFALAMAVARILFERGDVDPRAAEYCDHLDEFRALALRRSVEDSCALADVPREAAEALATRLGRERPCAILVGWGMGRRINGAGIVRALDALSAITGNLGVPGGGVSFYFWRRKAFDHSFIRGKDAAPRTVLEPLFGPELLAMKDPPIRAVWITAGNPVAMLPETNTTVKALSTREFVVVVDNFLTDTARLAHLVLPTTTLLEADDLLGSYGHHYVGVAQPVVDPPPGVRSDLQIMQGLAARTGLADALAGDARSWKKRILRRDLQEQGLTVEKLERDGAQRSPLSAPVLFADRRFKTASGRVNLVTEEPPAEWRAAAFPLWLMSLSTDKSQSSQWSATLEGPAEVTVHPDASGGIPAGALARLESAIGAMLVRVRHDPLQRRDVAILPKGGHLRDGRCANTLLRARATDLGEGGALYDEGVRLLPA
ncbi:MAG: molybdopterin-dependent oxidoreductase [Myxococcales bacterium]